MDFKEANKKIHPVETQWHYNIMIKAGFVPLDKEGVGFVRSYRYSKGDRSITVTTGYSSDHWVDNTTGERGYWGSLEDHLETLAKEKLS